MDWKFILKKWILRKGMPGSYETRVKKKLTKFRGNLFVDIGAHQGLYSLLLARNFRRIYAFEPNPAMIAVLIRRLKRQGILNVTVFPKALGDTVGKTVLYRDPHEGFGGSTDTILSEFDYNPNMIPEGGSHHVYLGKEGVEVDLSTYDTMVKEPADLVKIDVEGAEFKVLDGMKESLKLGSVKNLVVELHDKRRKKELEVRLTGYQLVWLDEDHVWAGKLAL